MITIPISCSEIGLLLLHPVVSMSLCILPLLVSRVFFHYFRMSCFVSIVWSCHSIFLVIPSFTSIFWFTSLSCIDFFNCCVDFLPSPQHILAFFLLAFLHFIVYFLFVFKSHQGFEFLFMFFRRTLINFSPA